MCSDCVLSPGIKKITNSFFNALKIKTQNGHTFWKDGFQMQILGVTICGLTHAHLLKTYIPKVPGVTQWFQKFHISVLYQSLGTHPGMKWRNRCEQRGKTGLLDCVLPSTYRSGPSRQGLCFIPHLPHLCRLHLTLSLEPGVQLLWWNAGMASLVSSLRLLPF